jgi:hypothetical protein
VLTDGCRPQDHLSTTESSTHRIPFVEGSSRSEGKNHPEMALVPSRDEYLQKGLPSRVLKVFIHLGTMALLLR